MPICSVPADLILLPVTYPPHNTKNVEYAFVEYARANEGLIPDDWHYIPITWTNRHCWENRWEKRIGYRASEMSQSWVNDNIDPAKKYFTVVQGDDGIFETIPDNIVVFGAGGTGDIPIPLTSMRHTPLGGTRHMLAYFAGQQECGGPVITGKHRSESSWDVRGQGWQCRTKMLAAFEGKPHCMVVNQHATSFDNVRRFVAGLGSTKFALAPRGYGKTSFRMYEAMQLGAIPVYIFDECWLPYEDFLDWDSLAVLCHVDDLEGLYDRLLSYSDETIAHMQATIQSHYDDYFSLEGTCKQVMRYIQEGRCDELVRLPKQR